MSESADLSTAIKTRWDATSGITGVIPTARLYSDSADGEPTMPYAVLSIKREKDPEYFCPSVTGAPYLDYRRATFRIYDGSKTGASTAANAVIAGLNAEFTVANSTHIDWEFRGESELAEDRATKNGETVYVATVEFSSILQRVVA